MVPIPDQNQSDALRFRSRISPSISNVNDVQVSKKNINEVKNNKNHTIENENENNEKLFTWQEVAKHNTNKSAWVIINNKIYDVTEWIDKHPGGKDMIVLHAGRECTDTFISYHPFSNDKPQKILKKYLIGQLKGPSEFPLYKPPKSGFYQECQNKVHEYFLKNNINPKSVYPGLIRMIFVFTFAFYGYCGISGFFDEKDNGNKTSYLFLSIFYCILFGVCQALPLLHLMHDCSHAAFSNNNKNWKYFGRIAMDFYAGGNLISWYNQHIVGHHIYTNVAGADPDLPVNNQNDVRRILEKQVFRPFYKYQVYYLPFLYGFLGIKFRIQDITDTFISRTNGPIRVNPHAKEDIILMIVSKLFWLTYRVFLPLLFINYNYNKTSYKAFFLKFLLTEMVTGWYLAFNFQVSHVSTDCDYSNDNTENTDIIQDEWAISQVKSCVDYSHNNFIITFLSGALNYQVTHHLFPGVSQYHYPAIAPIIMDVCKKHNIKYTVLNGFWDALFRHLRHLVIMGNQGTPVHVHMG